MTKLKKWSIKIAQVLFASVVVIVLLLFIKTAILYFAYVTGGVYEVEKGSVGFLLFVDSEIIKEWPHVRAIGEPKYWASDEDGATERGVEYLVDNGVDDLLQGMKDYMESKGFEELRASRGLAFENDIGDVVRVSFAKRDDSLFTVNVALSKS